MDFMQLPNENMLSFLNIKGLQRNEKFDWQILWISQQYSWELFLQPQNL